MASAIDGLTFNPLGEHCPKCPPDGHCDLTCCWEREPQLWTGDQA